MDLEIVKLGAAVLVNGTPTWQATIPVSNDNAKIESFGEVDTFQALGFAAMSAPPDADGEAEAIGARGLAGRDFVVFGGRDTRSATVQGKLGPGDTAMFATGPKKDAVAQVQCKAQKRQVLLATEDTNEETMVFVLDGKNKKVQLAAIGAMIEIDKDGDIAIVNSSGCGILIQSSGIHFKGPVHFPGIRPGMAIQQGPATGDPSGVAPTFAVDGIGG